MKLVDLSGTWSAYSEKTGAFTAHVPGCVHTDLATAGKIDPDFFWRDKAKDLTWIENEDFTYEKTFEIPKNMETENAILFFECLDTYATVLLNQKPIGETDDMFRTWSFPVGTLLKEGENILTVRFRSPIREVKDKPARSGAFTTERLWSRREQCTYGWDWVYRFVTCGIQRNCYILVPESTHTKKVYIHTIGADSESAQLRIIVITSIIQGGASFIAEVLNPDGKAVWTSTHYCEEDIFTEYADIPKPRLWYPTGYGEQPLYRLRITAVSGDRSEVFETFFGIRTVRLLQIPDAPGSEEERICKELQASESGRQYDFNEKTSSFLLSVNGKKIFCRGANWVPCDPFICNETDERITELLETAKEAGVNMLRVWGGGVFEKDFFYDECDRLGIAVTQDFLMACGNYPEEEPDFLCKISAEAKDAALRLRNHPCLMWWSGDNENAVLGDSSMKQYTGRSVAMKAIAPVLRRFDSERYFLPSSPYGGSRYASKTVGTTHNTQFLGLFLPYIWDSDLSDYRTIYLDYRARFVAEEPSFGAVSPSSLKKFMTEEDIFGNSMEEDKEAIPYFHTQTNPGLPHELLDYAVRFAEKLFGAFTDGEDRLYKLRYLQNEWVRLSFEQARRYAFFQSGVIYWMWNDCWPSFAGWSFIDWYGRPKDALFSFRRCAAPVMLSSEKREGCLKGFLCSTDEKQLRVRITVSTWNIQTSKLLDKKELNLTAEPNSVLSFDAGDIPARDQLTILDLYNEKNDLMDRTWYREGVPSIRRCDALSASVEETGRGSGILTVESEQLLFAVFPEGDAVFSDSGFLMLPGERKEIAFRKAASVREISATAYIPE